MSLTQLVQPIYDLAQNADNLSNLFTLSITKLLIYLGIAVFTIVLLSSLIWIVISISMHKKSLKIGLYLLAFSLVGLLFMICLLILTTFGISLISGF